MKMFLNTVSQALLLLGMLLLAGCFGGKQLDITSYNLTAPTVGKPSKEPKFSNLLVQDFYVNPAYEDKNFTYQTGELSYEADFYHQLKLSPRAQFTSLTRATLSDSGLFQTVIMPESLLAPDYCLEGNISKFYVDFRDSKNPKANLSITFRFYSIQKGSKELQLLLSQTYSESIPVSQKSADAIAHAWNTAFENIMQQLIKNLAKLPSSDSAPSKN